MGEPRTPIVATYSICACDLETGQWGVATQSKFLAVGSVVPWAAPHVGAIATQAYANPGYGPAGLELLRGGASADEVVEQLTAADDDRAQRQLGVVDGAGRGATFTGSECLDWAGGRAGDGYAAQGNILVSAETVDAMVDAFAATAGRPLAERLIDCLAAAQAAGGDRRGQQSAALLVVERDGGYAGLSDILVDLRTDDHERPVEELRRLYRLHHALFGKTPRADWLPVDDALRAEIEERLARARVRDAGRLGRRREPRGAGRRHRQHRSRRARGSEGRELTDSFQVMRLDEIEGYAEEGRPRWHMIRSVLGIESFGINAWRATEAGQEIIGEHDELGGGAGGHEELYFVLSGRATFTVAGERVDAPAGSIVFIKDPGDAARRGRRRGGNRDPRHRRAAGSRVLGLAVGAVCRGIALLDDRATGTAQSSSSTDSWRRIPTTRTSSTTSPVPRAAGAETVPRSST